MNISEPFIRRPIATTLLIIAVSLAGRCGFPPSAGIATAPGGLPDRFR